MKVLMIYGALTPSKGGGIASVISNIVKHTHSKVDYTLASFYDHSQSVEFNDFNKDRQELINSYPPSVEIKFVRNLNDYTDLFLSRNKFDILHCHALSRTSILPIVTRALGGFRPSIIYSHHVGVQRYVKGALELSLAQALLGGVSLVWNRVVVNTQYCATHELARFPWLRQKIVLIPNGVDINLIRNTLPKKLEGDPAILFLGHVTYSKGIDILIKSFNSAIRDSRTQRAHLHIVGSGDSAPWRELVSKDLENNVHFWGAVAHDTAIKFLQGADIVVVPSRYENFSITILEAMAAGKPVIATNVGGTPEFLKNGVNGILANPIVSEIAAALRQMIEDEASRTEIGRNNVNAVQQFSWDRIADKYIKLYEDSIR